MNAIIEIDGSYQQEPYEGYNSQLIQIRQSAEINLTLEIANKRSWRRTLRYELVSMDGDINEMIREIVERKNFSPSFDLFECPYGRDHITNLSIEWSRSNTFLAYLFDFLKGKNLEEFCGGFKSCR